MSGNRPFGSYPLHARMDPFLFPNQVSPHVHIFHGADYVPAAYDGNVQREMSTCNSAQVPYDNSLYWSPAMYYNNGSHF